MGYKISLDRLFYINNILQSQYSKLDAGANELYTAIENLVNGDNFKGQTANAIKTFLTEVHLGTIMPVLMQCGTEVIQKFGLYYSDYIDKIDNDIHACFTEETFEDLKEKYKNGYNNMYGPCNSIKAIVGTVNDLVSVKIPSKSNVDKAFDLCRGDINNTRNDVEGHEKQYLMYLQETRQFIDSIYELIKTYNSFDESAISGYKPGDINNMSAISNVCEKYYKSIEFSTKYESEIIKSADIQKATYDRLCEERKENAKANIIRNVFKYGKVAVFGIMTIATAGGTFGLSIACGSTLLTEIFCAYDIAENIDEYSLAMIGNTKDVAENDLRDIYFKGDKNAYNCARNISDTIFFLQSFVNMTEAVIKEGTSIAGRARAYGKSLKNATIYGIGTKVASDLTIESMEAIAGQELTP